ncbi:GL14789 [Drosophila persimilis]|uniref:GL14789 n=1 Tax=Drosophila persimilis TaxID=7234 RepID=B4HCI8_DROPE|nr:GL14789 [Drosophila persimilis]
MGGLWEAGVKSAKGLLLRAVGSALLTAEDLKTVLVGIEAVLNSRPLGPLSPDPSDGDALTPGHLLTGGPLIAPPAPRTPDQEGLSCLKRWRLVSSARQMFWQRWSREYVLGLQIRCKWHQEEPNIKEGDLVIVAEDNLPPQQWLLGRVVGTTAGQDGRALVVNNFKKMHTRTIATTSIGTQTAAKPPHNGSKRLRESPQMAAEPTKRQRGTVDYGATPAAKKQLKWQQVEEPQFSVVCAKKSCHNQITHDQPIIPCWLCDSVVLAKYAGFSGLVSDAISKRNGLHYSCEACRAVEKDMVAFMRQTRSGFKELTVGFKNQYDRLLAMEAQFSGLKLLNESPRRKKARDLQMPTVTQPCAAEKLTPITPSVQQLISFATPRATTAAGDADSVASCD